MRLLISMAVLLSLFFTSSRAFAAPPPDDMQKKIDSEIERVLRGLDVSALQSELDKLNSRPDEFASIKTLVSKMASGQFRYMGVDIMDYVISSFRQPVTGAALLFSELLLLLVVSGVLAQLMKAFTSEGAAKIANLTVYVAVAIIILNALRISIAQAQSAISTLLNVSQATFPILSMLLAATGGLMSSAVIQPAYSVVVETASWMTKELLIPAALFGSVMAIAGNLTEKSLLSEFGSLLRSGSVWIAGAVMTIFVAIASIQSSAAVSYDGISFRAAKYAVDSMIPYVGGMFSDMADTFVGCSLLVRNAVGMAGLLSLVVIMIQPVLTALCTWFAFKMAAAVAGSFESKQLCNIMNESSKIIVLLIVIMLMAFLMLFIITTITINAGNSILAMR